MSLAYSSAAALPGRLVHSVHCMQYAVLVGEHHQQEPVEPGSGHQGSALRHLGICKLVLKVE